MHRARVQMLRDMLWGIPDERVDLDTVWNGKRPCDTIACIGGWAGIYPPFVKQGLRWSNWSEFFDLPKASGLFAVAGGDKSQHKQIALRRLDALLDT